MKTQIKSLFFVIFLFGTVMVSAQLDDHVDWSYSKEKISDNEVVLIFKADIEPRYHLYSQYFPEGGPNRLEFQFTESDKYKRIGKVSESPKPKEEYDDIFKIDVQYFESKATFKQKIKILSEEDFTIKVKIAGQTCFEDGSCILVDDGHTFTIKGVPQQTVQDKAETEQTESDKRQDETETAENADSVSKMDFDVIEAETESEATIAQQAEGDATPGEVISKDEPKEKESLWWFFLIAIGAGLLGTLTPCVFPMIPMTVTFFLNSSKSKAKSTINAIVYGLSIIILYTAIGVIVSLTSKGADLPGFISTNWIINLIFFALFLLFGASFFGMFEIVLPGSLVNKTDKQADKGGIIGAFFMALTLVIVSFSCTGPIVGGLLVEAASGAVIKPTVGMFGFGLGFALPFTLFAFFPSLLKKMPKSGGWLNSVKVVLGFVMLAFGMKFLLNADTALHLGLLDRDIFIAIWIVLFSLMGFYLLGKIRFSHDSEVKHLSFPRMLLAVATFSFVLYLIPGLFGAPLKAISAFLPHPSTHDFDLTSMIRKQRVVQSDVATTLCDEKPLYSDFLHLPHDLEGYFDYEQALACAKKQNKPLFLDFTGHGCGDCKKMEAQVWSDPEVLKRLQNDYIVVALYVDERTELPEKKWVTSVLDGEVKKTIGAVNADFRATRYRVNAQPYYVLIDTNEEMLTEPFTYNTDVEEFIEFLDKGKKEFNNQ